MEMTVEQAIKEIWSWYLPTTKQREARAVINNALTENKKLKKEINKEIDIVKIISDECKQLRDLANKAETENDKLKDSINKMSRNRSNLIEENEKLKEEIEQLKVDKEIALEQMVNAKNDFVELNNQMSAVEVLEWLKNADEFERRKLFGNHGEYVSTILTFIHSQDIVDRITEYEKEHHFVNAGNMVSEPVSNCDEFNVGDWVKKKDGTTIAHKIVSFSMGKEYPVIEDLCGSFVEINPEEWEYAEPPKEHDGCYKCKYEDKNQYQKPCVNCKGTVCSTSDEYKTRPDLWEEKKESKPQVEWVWECAYIGCDGDYYVKEYFNTENEAINYCENNADKVFGYRKVCKKKDC